MYVDAINKTLINSFRIENETFKCLQQSRIEWNDAHSTTLFKRSNNTTLVQCRCVATQYIHTHTRTHTHTNDDIIVRNVIIIVIVN